MSATLSLTAWYIILTIFHTLAISSTTFRLWRRYTMRKLWWDDFWAFVALLVDLLFFASVWLRREIPPLSNDPQPPPPLRRIVLFWLSALLTPCVAWPARVSMCMSISRLAPPTAKRRRALFSLAVVFLILGAVLTAQKIWACARNSARWQNTSTVQCYTGKTVGYLSLASDIAGDTCLVAIPLRMLWGVKLPRKERRLVLSLFASNILSTLAGIVYAVFIFRAKTFGKYRTVLVNMTAHIKAAVTLLVCNLLIIVTYIYSKYRSDGMETDEEEEEDSGEEARVGLTTPSPVVEKSEPQTQTREERPMSPISLTPISTAHFSSRNTASLITSAAARGIRDTSTFFSKIYTQASSPGSRMGATRTGMGMGTGRFGGSRAVSWAGDGSKHPRDAPG